jgi:glycosyltransferase involved in cell wall biosynthesis
VVRGWGGRALVVHEPPAPWTDQPVDPSPATGERVLFLGTYGRDEPVAEVVDGARQLPGVEFRITGDPATAPDGLLERRPANVEPLGYLHAEAYQREVRSADLVVVLTTEPTSVMRAAYEAVYACRPLVVTDWPALREIFPHAVHVPNTPDGIAAGVRRALDDLDGLRAVAETARTLQTQRWEAQLAALRDAVG